MDLSLADIIRKKFNRYANARGRGKAQMRRSQPGGGNQNQNKQNLNRRGSQPRRGSGGNNSTTVSDARLRIIQKKRQKLTDAREKLAEIAKQSDARLKLVKLRENRSSSGQWSNVSITRRTGRNGQISLSTNKKPRGKSAERVISAGRSFQRASPELSVETDDLIGGSPLLRRTVTNERTLPIVSQRSLAPPASRRALYTWVNDDPRPEEYEANVVSTGGRHGTILRHAILGTTRETNSVAQQVGLKITAKSNPLQQKFGATTLSDRAMWNYDAPTVKHAADAPVARMDLEESDEDELSPWRRGPVRMSSELKARLDTPAVSVSRSMGILSKTPASPGTQNTTNSATGHRIVVSNLQPSVTQEDIRELFEDIGPLITSRLVRPGTAEVVYQQRKDAMKAVDVYHNRQLDGQPMKCMLVNSRPQTMPGVAQALNRSTGGSSSFILPTGGKSSVIPDVSTIHKALFNKT